MKKEQELLFKMADDALIMSHRNSEWTGIGPILEEDIAFSSMAQDKLGHAYQLYTILHNEFGQKLPDDLAFFRQAKDFVCCQFVELSSKEYDFSLVRHFLFAHAEIIRYNMLTGSSVQSLAELAVKISGELKYHVLHADTWIQNLGTGNEESKSRMQSQLDYAFPFALGIFEPGGFEKELASDKVFEGEAALQARWLDAITPILEKATLKVPKADPEFGGRKGKHTEFLQDLLNEMSEVINLDPKESW